MNFDEPIAAVIDRNPESWPDRSYLELGAATWAVPLARLHARQALGIWGLGDSTGAAEIVVSELVTNAVSASEGVAGSCFMGQWSPGRPPIRLWLASQDDRVVIGVWDGSDDLPEQQAPDDTAERGRGLMLIDVLSTSWGVCRPDKSSGKVVWAVASSEASAPRSP